MKKALCILALVACILLISCAERNTSAEGKMEAGTMEYFIQSLDLKVDGTYKEILAERKHKGDRVAPEIIRAFIEGLGITRFSFSQGVKFQAGKATLWWFISDFGAKGEPEEVLTAIRSILEKHGFNAQEPKEDEHGWMEYTFDKKVDKLDYLVKMKEFDRFVGSKEPMCGGDIVCEITYDATVKQPTVEGMIELYPEIACPELPAEVLDFLKEQKIEYMKYGGTWERYYTWGVSIPTPDKKAAENMIQDVTSIIEKIGFSVWKEKDGETTFQRAGTGGETSSFMDLEIDEGNIFMLRFQPRS